MKIQKSGDSKVKLTSTKFGTVKFFYLKMATREKCMRFSVHLYLEQQVVLFGGYKLQPGES